MSFHMLLKSLCSAILHIPECNASIENGITIYMSQNPNPLWEGLPFWKDTYVSNGSIYEVMGGGGG